MCLWLRDSLHEIDELLHVVAPGSRSEARAVHERLQATMHCGHQGLVFRQQLRNLVLLNPRDHHLQSKSMQIIRGEEYFRDRAPLNNDIPLAEQVPI